MTDALDLLSRRNPVDEAALPTRDARAAEDLTRILGEPTPAGRPPRRSAPRPVRIALGVAGVAGIAALMGGLFLFPPGEDDAQRGAGTIPGADWGLEATIRVDPAPEGPGLDEATRRAAELIDTRARAFGVAGARATVIAPGAIRFVVPWATLPVQITHLVTPPDWALHDLTRGRLGDSRRPRAAIAALRGRPSEPRGPWYAFDSRSLGFQGGPFDAPVPGATGVRWVRAAAGRIAVTTSVTPEERTGRFPFVVLRDTPVAHGGDITGVRAEGRTLIVSLAGPVPGGRLAIVLGGSVIAEAITVSPGGVRMRTLLPGSAREFGRALAGGGIEADLAVDAIRPVGDPPRRTGDGDARLPEAARSSLLIVSPGPGPDDRVIEETVLRVLSTVVAGERREIWEGLTAAGGNRYAEVGPGGAGGSVNCGLDWTARTIRRCVSGPQFMTGRYAPSVVSMELRRRDGRSEPVVMQNGWFLTVSRAERGARIVALDEDGKMLREIPR